MITIPLGKIAVATAGTIVQVTSAPTFCHAIIVSQIAASTGVAHFGTSTLVASTLVGVVKTFLKPSTTGLADVLVLKSPGGNLLNAADYWVDVAVNGEGLLVSLLQI
jgi:uncharacterized protein (UPF0254 family)